MGEEGEILYFGSIPNFKKIEGVRGDTLSWYQTKFLKNLWEGTIIFNGIHYDYQWISPWISMESTMDSNGNPYYMKMDFLYELQKDFIKGDFRTAPIWPLTSCMYNCKY